MVQGLNLIPWNKKSSERRERRINKEKINLGKLIGMKKKSVIREKAVGEKKNFGTLKKLC